MSTLPTRPPLCLNIKITNRIPLLNDYSPIDEMSLNFASDFDPNVVKYYRTNILDGNKRLALKIPRD